MNVFNLKCIDEAVFTDCVERKEQDVNQDWSHPVLIRYFNNLF